MLKVLMTLVASLMFVGSMAFAHDMEMWNKDLTKEQRAVLADHHEKMAACLRSDKTLKECHEEMEQHCKEMGDKCPMNEEHEHGHMHDHAKKNAGKPGHE